MSLYSCRPMKLSNSVYVSSISSLRSYTFAGVMIFVPENLNASRMMPWSCMEPRPRRCISTHRTPVYVPASTASSRRSICGRAYRLSPETTSSKTSSSCTAMSCCCMYFSSIWRWRCKVTSSGSDVSSARLLRRYIAYLIVYVPPVFIRSQLYAFKIGHKNARAIAFARVRWYNIVCSGLYCPPGSPGGLVGVGSTGGAFFCFVAGFNSSARCRYNTHLRKDQLYCSRPYCCPHSGQYPTRCCGYHLHRPG